MNLFFSPGHIALWLLFAGLFFPRLALAIAWLSTQYPANTMPDLLNLVLWLFIPRFLMAFYVYTDQGANNFWFWAYLVLGLVGVFGESRFADRKVFRRKRYVRTTVEEV